MTFKVYQCIVWKTGMTIAKCVTYREGGMILFFFKQYSPVVLPVYKNIRWLGIYLHCATVGGESWGTLIGVIDNGIASPWVLVSGSDVWLPVTDGLHCFLSPINPDVFELSISKMSTVKSRGLIRRWHYWQSRSDEVTFGGRNDVWNQSFSRREYSHQTTEITIRF